MGTITFKADDKSAYRKTWGDFVHDKLDGNKLRANCRERRRLIEDYCDYCLSVVMVKREFIHLRTKGYKVACKKCIKEKGLKKNIIYTYRFDKNIKK